MNFSMQRAILRINRQRKSADKHQQQEEMSKKILVIFTENAEETETVIVVDTLRRADFKINLASLAGEEPVACVNGTRIFPDIALDKVSSDDLFDAVVVPGGPGIDSLSFIHVRLVLIFNLIVLDFVLLIFYVCIQY
jgi:hypothetical protein